jgi:hypothetical protein
LGVDRGSRQIQAYLRAVLALLGLNQYSVAHDDEALLGL